MAEGPGRSARHRFVAFRHARFRAEVSEEDIDRRSPGEDCTRWLHTALLSTDGVAPLVDPLEEDWGGWTFAVRVDGVGFWVHLWPGLEDPRRTTWILGLAPRFSLSGLVRRTRTRTAEAHLREAIDTVLASAPEVADRRWLGRHPGG